MTERRLNMIIEKEYFDSEEVRKANAMNDKDDGTTKKNTSCDNGQ